MADDSILQDPRVTAFADAAREYCTLIDKHESIPNRALILQLAGALSRLFAAAVTLCEVIVERPEIKPPGDCSNRTRDYFTLREKLTAKFGEDYLYWIVFDPYEKAEPIQATLSGELAEVYQDVEDGLATYVRSEANCHEAVWNWRFSFLIHWGRHCSSALRAIHRLLEGFEGDSWYSVLADKDPDLFEKASDNQLRWLLSDFCSDSPTYVGLLLEMWKRGLVEAKAEAQESLDETTDPEIMLELDPPFHSLLTLICNHFDGPPDADAWIALVGNHDQPILDAAMAAAMRNRPAYGLGVLEFAIKRGDEEIIRKALQSLANLSAKDERLQQRVMQFIDTRLSGAERETMKEQFLAFQGHGNT